MMKGVGDVHKESAPGYGGVGEESQAISEEEKKKAEEEKKEEAAEEEKEKAPETEKKPGQSG